MSDLNGNSRNQVIKILATIAELYPHSSIARKLDGSDDRSYESMIGVWSAALDGISQERIAIGLRKLVQGGSTFEPSVPEFVAMCKSKPAAHRYYKALPQSVHNGPASIDHYPPAVQHQLTKIGMVPKKGETQHDYCMRCKEFVFQSKAWQTVSVEK